MQRHPRSAASAYFVKQLTERDGAHAKDWRHNMNIAALLMGDGRTERAIKHYEIALHENPTCPPLSNDMGLALLKMGNRERAFHFFQQAVDLNPLFWQAHVNLSAHYARAGSYRKSFLHITEAVRINPGSALIHRNKAKILDQLGCSSESIIHNEIANQLEAKSETHLKLGVQHLTQGIIRPKGGEQSKQRELALQHTAAGRHLAGRRYHFQLFSRDPGRMGSQMVAGTTN
jgi:tetratricopeptide (TPR) repeat protein